MWRLALEPEGRNRLQRNVLGYFRASPFFVLNLCTTGEWQ